MGCCECCIPTPYSIKKNEEIDVFADCIESTESYYDQKYTILWDVYGDTGIGNTNIEYWERRVKAMYSRIKAEYDLKIKAWIQLSSKVDKDGADFNDTSSETSRSTNSDGSVTQKVESGNLKVTNDLKSCTYDPAQNAESGAESFLSDMSTDTGSVTTEDTRVNKSTTTGSGTETVKTLGSSGLETVTLKEWIEGVRNPLYDFADEFKKLFYWGM